MSALAKPAPYRVIDGFLGEEMVERTLAYSAANQALFRKAGLYGKGVNERWRVALVTRELGPLAQELEAAFRAVADRAVAELGMTPFTVGRLEIELAAHGDGAFFERHSDTAWGTNLPDAERVLTGVWYFHALPKGYSGGELRMHSFLPADQGGSFVDLEVRRDMLLLFPSWASHEVRPVSCPSRRFEDWRFAVNCWFHRAQRQIAP